VKVVFLYRQPREWLFSIETVFDLVKRGLSGRLVIGTFYSTGNILSDLFRVMLTKADIYHITGHTHYLSLASPSAKTVLTIHDLGHYEKTLTGFTRWLYGLLWFRLPLRKVRYITTISHFTKERLLAHFPIDRSRIKVIYNPVDPQYVLSERLSSNEVPIILQIGSGHNKNIGRLIEAVKGVECILLLVGKLNLGIKQRMDDLSIRYINKVNVPNSEMVNVYQQADLLFFASTYEGFGLPIIEANACGIPVITSNQGAMAEISDNGNAACLVDPTSVDEIAQGINKILHNEHYRRTLIKNGLNNARQFDHRLIADQYFEYYQSIKGNT